MDLTPFLPLFTGVLGSLAALGGVWITARSARRAEDKRLDLEERREAIRLAREDEAERRSSEEQRHKTQIEIYRSIAELFVGELSNLRAQRATNPSMKFKDFDAWFAKEWPVHPDMRLRRAIAGLADDEHRYRITQICDAIIDYDAVALMEFNEGGDQVEELLTLGFDLASTYARGQTPGDELNRRWEAFVSQVNQAIAWHEEQRAKQLEVWRQEAEARQQAKRSGFDESPF